MLTYIIYMIEHNSFTRLFTILTTIKLIKFVSLNGTNPEKASLEFNSIVMPSTPKAFGAFGNKQIQN